MTEKLGRVPRKTEWSAIPGSINRLRKERTKIGFHSRQVGGGPSYHSHREASGFLHVQPLIVREVWKEPPPFRSSTEKGRRPGNGLCANWVKG